MYSPLVKSRLQIELLRSLWPSASPAPWPPRASLWWSSWIVVAVVGILSAVALPRYLAARAAAAGSAIAEKVGLAKECATYLAAGDTFSISWTQYGQSVAGLRCLDFTNGITGFQQGTITVTPAGGLSCVVAP